MKKQDYEQLMLSLEDSLASRSVVPGSREARKMTVTSGLKCFESYGKSARCTSLVRTCLESSIWHSTRCFLSWKTKATKHNRLLFQLAVSTPRTGETEYLFWPTPSTGASLCGGTGNLQQLRKLAQAGKMTADELRNLSSGGGGNTNPELIEWLMGYEKAFTRLMPTARSSDYKGAASTRFFGGGYYRKNLTELLEATPLGIVGRANPEYLEWFMGFPTGWTELSA